MRVSWWLLLVTVMVSLGALQVAARTAVILKSYAVGDRVERLHDMERDLCWAGAQVAGMASPVRLARVAEERGLKLVAWSTLPTPTVSAALQAVGDVSEPAGLVSRAGLPVVHVASAEPVEIEAGTEALARSETSD